MPVFFSITILFYYKFITSHQALDFPPPGKLTYFDKRFRSIGSIHLIRMKGSSAVQRYAEAVMEIAAEIENVLPELHTERLVLALPKQ